MVIITFNIEKKHIYLTTLFILLAISIAFVVSYGGNNPSVMGHSAAEIDGLEAEVKQIITNNIETIDGLDDYIIEIVNNEIAGIGELTCSSTPLYDSMATGPSYKNSAYRYNDGIKTVPASCKTDVGCIIKQEIYDKNSNLKIVRKYSYSQDSVSGIWWSDYQKSGKYINGDTNTKNIIPAYASSTILLRDDYYKTGANSDYTKEDSKDQWTFIDKTINYGMKIYICSEQSDGEV